MKKVFMPVAVVAMIIAVAACGSNNSKKAEEVETVLEENVEADTDSTVAAIDSLEAAAQEIAEEVVAE